nr:NADH dehydrogenase subunit 6 [Polionemobius taprobanensis]
MLVILFTMILLNFILPFLNHPLSITILMLLQSLLICLLMCLINTSSWFSYILFLSFLGGMLVLFIYMTTLASNELMSFPLKSFMISTTSSFFIVSYFNMNFNSIFIFYPNFSNNFLLNLPQLFTFPNIMLTIIMISYLLISLIAVIKISNLNQGTLRQS